MQRSQSIPVLEELKGIAAKLNNSYIDAFKAEGGRVVGCFWPETPVEILEAAGLMPFDMRGTGATGTEYADAYFRPLTCEFARTTFNQILDNQYGFLDGAVLYNCCDHLRRVEDNWKTLPGNPVYHFLYVPKKCDETTFAFYQDEFKAFVKATEEKFGVEITPEKLSAAILEANRTRALVRELYDIRKADALPIDGAEVNAVLTAGCSMPRRIFNEKLAELLEALKTSETVTPRVRIYFAGGHAAKPDLLEVLETEGGMIVADEYQNGLKTAKVDVCEKCDPMTALMNHYFWKKPPMPRVFGTQNERMADVVKTLEAWKVDGAVTARLTMCDVWAFEQYMLAGLFTKHNLPHVQLEVNYILDGIGQIRTRVQAFVENCPKRC